MLAIDQRESMRAMFAEKHGAPVPDDVLVRFKLDALKALTPYASAVLIDREFGWRPAVETRAVDAGCALIAAADRFTASETEIVADVEIDGALDPAAVKRDGAVALKLLVTWRPDENPDKRIAMVDRFVGICKASGLLSIIEPVARAPRDGRRWVVTNGILAAARELGKGGRTSTRPRSPFMGGVRRRTSASSVPG